MLKPLLFATLAAIGNGIMVYGQRGAAPPSNPFLFILAAIAACLLMFMAAAYLYRTDGDMAYIGNNLGMIGLSGVGFFLTFVGFFLLYNGYGASQYTLYAVISILTTSLGVGVLIYKEDFNIYKVAAMVFAMIAIALFTYGNTRGG